MTTTQWILIAGLGIYTLFAFLNWLTSFLDRKDVRVSRFKEELVAAIQHSQPQWEQITAIAETSNIPISRAYQATRELYKDILTGKNKELNTQKELIEGYIKSYQRAEPFEGLPNEIRLHLERVSEALADKTHLLDPLTAKIRDLVTIHKREYKIQKRYTRWGFVVGVLGLLFAAYTYYHPCVGNCAFNIPGLGKVLGQ